MNFNKKLLKLRNERGLSQDELGDKISVLQQTISKWGSANPILNLKA
ncbi:MAG: helix-turn-helix transcriptional regulator [Turicibacter sp.]|nr:helix-turn-helix transcriptional regulator [Turicibacter sp.]